MKKIQSTTVCQEGVENGMNHVFTSAPDSVDMSTSVPYFIRDPPILPTLEGEETTIQHTLRTWTGTSSDNRCLENQKEKKNFGRQSDYDITDWRNKKIEK
ncbi:hypothetical protein JTB14_002735 [Gonioctena quinquepunctata]|nr:hypothetical protein JTB14_002735 [Gonioctena quinquepunctata]